MSRLNPLHVEKAGDSQLNHWSRSCNSKPVLESHLDLLREGAFSDVTFIVGSNKERIPCHQIFLKARSPVFQLMLAEQGNGHSQEIPLEDVDPKIFRKFLEFIYSDTFDVDVSEALELLQVAHKYDVQLLVNRCENFLENEVTLDHVLRAARKRQKFEHMDKVDLLSNLMAHFGTDGCNKKSMPKFASPRPAIDNQSSPVRPLPPGSVALYSGDFSDYEIRRQTYNGLLYECVNVSIHVLEGAIGIPKRTEDELSNEWKNKDVGVSGISFYCPKSTNVSSPSGSNSTKVFRVFVDVGESPDKKHPPPLWSPYITAEEGKMTAVKFDPALPVSSRRYFQFSVQESETRAGDQDYEARDFGNMQQSVTTNVGNKLVLVASAPMRSADVLSGRYPQPQLIYKLSFKEL